MEDLEKEIQKILEKRKELKLDLSKDEDLVIGIMNLISLEEHLFFSGVKTENKKYYDLLIKIRDIRKKLMKKIIKKVEEGSEIWCISKHLLASAMRLYETGEKLLDIGKRDEAEELFNYSYEIFSIFWGLNLGIISKENVKEIIESNEKIRNSYYESKNIEKEIESKLKRGKIDKLKEIIRKIIDCCIE